MSRPDWGRLKGGRRQQLPSWPKRSVSPDFHSRGDRSKPLGLLRRRPMDPGVVRENARRCSRPPTSCSLRSCGRVGPRSIRDRGWRLWLAKVPVRSSESSCSPEPPRRGPAAEADVGFSTRPSPAHILGEEHTRSSSCLLACSTTPS